MINVSAKKHGPSGEFISRHYKIETYLFIETLNTIIITCMVNSYLNPFFKYIYVYKNIHTNRLAFFSFFFYETMLQVCVPYIGKDSEYDLNQFKYINSFMKP